MKTIITEKMRLIERIVKYAVKKDNNSKAARRYHTSRQQVQRWRKKYNGTINSLAEESRRPKSHPNEHSIEEIKLIKKKSKRFKHEGLAQVYVECRKSGYTRSYGSMCNQIRKLKVEIKKIRKNFSKSNWKPDKVTYPGEKVQIDIKYVPLECIGFDSYGKRYYQITAIDEYSRKRVLEIVDEKSVTHTSKFLETLEERMGFKIKTVQTDNGYEFVNDVDRTKKISRFQRKLEILKIRHKRTRPYSPWQNGKVERSHRLDNDMFYSRRVFKNFRDMMKQIKRYANRYNNIARQVLYFKSPNEVVKKFSF